MPLGSPTGRKPALPCRCGHPASDHLTTRKLDGRFVPPYICVFREDNGTACRCGNYNPKGTNMLGEEEIEHRFGFHKATIEGENATLPKHARVRLAFREFGEFLDKTLPEGRAKAVAFTELETASMWAHKAIAETAPVVREDV